MCGICGFYSPAKLFSKPDLEKMAAALAHRGPDAEGFFMDEISGLGHRRLSIIDLSIAANQPMYSTDRRYVISYNGEVYNYNEIAKEMNLILRTTSDTEVILEAFIKEGVDFVHRLNGMFAIAIYDTQEKKLFLFRDRMGVKPLYYFWDGINFVFASELKALLKIKFIKEKIKINKSVISSFLHLGYIPEPDTVYENIFKLPAGHILVVHSKEFAFRRYWCPEEKILEDTISNFVAAKSKFKELMKSSVKYRLISDVSYGCFLSGGTDSSLITAMAQELTGNIKTFSIGFNETKYNESVYAKTVADYLKTDHHEFRVSYKDAIDLFDELTSTYDEPFADSSAIPTMLVSKIARKSVKMTLSGDGGDELFFGYGSYHWAKRLANPVILNLRKPIYYLLSQMGNREKRASHLFLFTDRKKIKNHIFSQEQNFFSEEEIKKLLYKEIFHETPIDPLFFTKRKLSSKEEQALYDLKFYLKDDLLVKIDRASMKFGLETRVPFLDYRVVEFAMNLSPKLKSIKGIDKFLLKETLYDYIPKKYFDRPKWGFSLPISLWLKNELRYLIDDNLNKIEIESYGIINYSVVENLKKRFFEGENYLFNRLWVLIILQKFLKNSA